MVDQTNIERVQTLLQQRGVVRQSLWVLEEENGTIKAFLLAGRDAPQHESFQDATGIAYPPQMITAIKDQCTSLLSAIDGELSGLGVTGLETGNPFPTTPVDPNLPPRPPGEPSATMATPQPKRATHAKR